MLSDSTTIAAGANTSAALSLGPVAPRDRITHVQLWCDPTDSLANDAFSVRIVVSERPQDAGEVSGLRSQVTTSLSAVGAPGLFRFPLVLARGRWVTVVVAADNTAGATAFRFGAAIDFEREVPSSGMARPGPAASAS